MLKLSYLFVSQGGNEVDIHGEGKSLSSIFLLARRIITNMKPRRELYDVISQNNQS